MRKFSKIVLGAAAVLTVAGLGLSTGGVAMGASLFELDLKKYYDFHDMGRFLRLADWDEDWDDWEEDWDEDSGKILSLNDDGVYTADSVSELELHLKYDELILQESEGDEVTVRVSGDGEDNVRLKQEGGELEIESRKKVEDRTVTVSYPADMEFRKVSIEVEQGIVSLDDDLDANELEVSVGAGTFDNSAEVTAREADIEVSAGTIELSDLDAQKISAECGMGSMDLSLAGAYEDYNYSLECGAGSISLGDEGEYSGVGTSRKVKNPNASRRMEIECGMGEVNVDFEE